MISVICGALLLGNSVFFAAPDKKAETLLQNYNQKLSACKSLSVETESLKGAASAGKASFTFVKPNFVRIETPGKVQVFDGSNYSELFTASQQYFTRPAKKDELPDILGRDDVMAWSGFFTGDMAKLVKTASYDGKDTVDKKSFDCVKVVVDPTAKKTARLYVDPADGLVKHVEFRTGSQTTGLLVLTTRFDVDTITDGATVCKLPDNAKQVAEADLVGAKWYRTWGEAVAAAKASGKTMMVDFYTDWCHWCKELDKNVFTTSAFADMARNFILVKINAEKGEGIGLASKYGVDSYPRLKFIKADGTEVHEIAGYMETAGFVGEMRKALGK